MGIATKLLDFRNGIVLVLFGWALIGCSGEKEESFVLVSKQEYLESLKNWSSLDMALEAARAVRSPMSCKMNSGTRELVERGTPLTPQDPVIRVKSPNLAKQPLKAPVRLDVAWKSGAKSADIDVDSLCVFYKLGNDTIDKTSKVNKCRGFTFGRCNLDDEGLLVKKLNDVTEGSYFIVVSIRDDEGRETVEQYQVNFGSG
jgi:hypothetical protein